MAVEPTPTGSTVVTGATGFAGSHLVDRLVRGGDPSGIVAWHRPAHTPPQPRPLVRWAPVDVLDREGVRRALEDARPSRLYHVAGAARVDTAWTNVVPHLQTNVLGTHHILTAIRELALPCRVVVVTSGMLYRPGADAVGEDAPLEPPSPYGLSKLAQDQLALRAVADDGLDVVVARPFNHIGPRQTPHFAVASFARQIARIEAGRAEPAIHVGNLEAARDLTDVRDVAGAYERLMEKGTRGRAYNVCSGHAVPIRQVLDELVRLARVDVNVVVDADRFRPSDTPVVLGNPGRLREELGWTPEFALTATLRDTLDWWRADPSRTFV